MSKAEHSSNSVYASLSRRPLLLALRADGMLVYPFPLVPQNASQLDQLLFWPINHRICSRTYGWAWLKQIDDGTVAREVSEWSA